MKKWLTATFIALSLALCAMAAEENTSKKLTELKFTTPQKVQQELKPLPKKDIERFVTAIAIIHHYYIKDINNNDLFNNAIRGMVTALDPHSTYLDQNDMKELKTTISGRFVGIGVELTLKDGLLKVISPLEGSPAQKAGIKPNDLIIKVNGTLVKDMTLSQAIKRIKGNAGTFVNLTVAREGADKPLEIKVRRDVVKLVTVKSKMLESGYGYVHLTFFQGPVEREMRDAINTLKKQAGGKLKGLVLDLRNNPGGLLDMAGAVADDFLDANKLNNKYDDLIVYTKGRVRGSNMKMKAHPGDLVAGTPMVVLINGGSASASEIVAGALQDYGRALIMGTRSFGKGSVQTVLPINEDHAIKLTTALYYTPAGRVIQANGIVPDITVPTLSITDKDEKNFGYDEANFSNRLPGSQTVEQMRADAALREKIVDEELKIAKEDYQLYQALMTLKSLHASPTF